MVFRWSSVVVGASTNPKAGYEMVFGLCDFFLKKGWGG